MCRGCKIRMCNVRFSKKDGKGEMRRGQGISEGIVEGPEQLPGDQL